MTTIEKDTKQKILNAANELFAKNGFAGASIREIATEAGVNLAAINYHFRNKENLFWEVFDRNYALLEHGIGEIGKRTTTTVELTTEVFRFFLSDQSALVSNFRIFISDNIKPPEAGRGFEIDKKMGPPGESAFLEKIRHDLGAEISVGGQRWATKMIFSLLVHFGVVLNTAVMQIKCEENDELQPRAIEGALRKSVQAHLNYLKENPKDF